MEPGAAGSGGKYANHCAMLPTDLFAMCVRRPTFVIWFNVAARQEMGDQLFMVEKLWSVAPVLTFFPAAIFSRRSFATKSPSRSRFAAFLGFLL